MIRATLTVLKLVDKALDYFGLNEVNRKRFRESVNDVASELASGKDLRQNEREARDTFFNKKSSLTDREPSRLKSFIKEGSEMKKFEVTFDNGKVNVVGDFDEDGTPSFKLEANLLEGLTELWDIFNSRKAT